MRLAISNIAWDVAEDEAIASLLRRHGIDMIDVAPGKYFPEPSKARDEDIARVRDWWRDRGFEIYGMQALLFGTTGLNLFGPPEVRDAMLRHLATVCRIGAGLGARHLVFGSPRNRDRTGLTDRNAMDQAISFFRKLGDAAGEFGVVFCLEPNPPCYGANFMTTWFETLRVVQEVAHPCIKVQLDTGALTINNEDISVVVPDCVSFIGHVHASEPDLKPLGDAGTDHGKAAEALRQHLPDHVVSIEMLATAGEPHETSIERALQVAIRHYRDGHGAIA